MVGGKLYVFNASTSTAAATFQDIGLSVPASNPLVLDQTGRVPQFYVADGFYRIRLQDASGQITNGGFDYPSVPSIGASTSGGGGSGVDPTTILSTGDMKFQPLQGTLSGFIRVNGRTIGNASSGATERANADCQSLFLWIWSNLTDTYCPVIGGRGASAAADWGAGKQITLLDLRGRGPFGLDDMGNTAAGRLSTVSTNTPTTPGSSGGLDSVVLTEAQLATHNHGGSTGNDSPDHTHGIDASANLSYSPGGAASQTPTSTKQSSGANVRHTHTIPNDGSNQAHPNMPPFVLGTWFQKL